MQTLCKSKRVEPVGSFSQEHKEERAPESQRGSSLLWPSPAKRTEGRHSDRPADL